MNKKQWLASIKSREPFGLAANCKWALAFTKRSAILRKLIREGKVIRTRESRGGRCKRTILSLPQRPQS